MEIDIKTAVDGCARYCPNFQIEVINLYSNNETYNRAYRCEYLAVCQSMLTALFQAKDTVTVKNIY